jgi:hypothetical protein
MGTLTVDSDARIDRRNARLARREARWTDGRAPAYRSMTDECDKTADAPPAMVTVFYGGHSFPTSTDMARIFLEKALQILDEGESALVPLNYAGGVELLLIAPHAQFSLGPAPASSPARFGR